MNLHLALLADIKNQLKVIQNIIVYHIVEIFSLRVLKVKLLSLVGNIVKLDPNFLFFASKIVPDMEFRQFRGVSLMIWVQKYTSWISSSTSIFLVAASISSRITVRGDFGILSMMEMNFFEWRPGTGGLMLSVRMSCRSLLERSESFSEFSELLSGSDMF
jgi:hypothetical protein